MQSINPLTNSEVVLEDTIDPSLIIQLYAQDYEIDVSEYFYGIDSVKIYKCLKTGYRFFYPFSLVGKDDLYVKLQVQSWYYGLRYEHDLAEKFIMSGQTILEIGCGRGYFLELLKNKGVNCKGLELNKSAITFARDKELDVSEESLEEHSKNNFEKYDVVCSFQVLEHVVDVGNFIQSSLDALKIEGLLMIAVPNSNPFLYDYDKNHTLNNPPHHMGLWNVDSLTKLQEIYNLQLNNLFTEPLHEHEYDLYFKIRCENFKLRKKIMGSLLEFILLKLKPHQLRLRVQRMIAKRVSGRNLLAIYKKTR